MARPHHSVIATLAEIKARAGGGAPPAAPAPPAPGAPLLVPALVALDRSGGHSSIREDMLVPVNGVRVIGSRGGSDLNARARPTPLPSSSSP